ncbi:MAG TPA: diacylglycerol kinase family protein [Acidimicrobiia bacterium]|nr:diacylglycerol kinase family protein [Acidimicrobiia bacterium]
MLRRDDNLQELARAAISQGADVLGMAGGDGSQAMVAEFTMEHDVPFVCVPAGTRNQLALDLGIDRNDLIGSLDAFEHGRERRIDLGRVNDRVFVNNMSLGVYAAVVQSPEYRDDKLGTVARMLPELLGADYEPFDLEFEGPTGSSRDSADLILVSNNVYDLDRIAGFGTRARLDAGVLGIVAVEVRSSADLAELVALQTTGGVSRARGWRQWTATSFEVRSSEPIAAGVDGEALVLASPLRVVVLASALRVRIAPRHSRRSPAAAHPRVGVNSLIALLNIAFRGR